jgi:hypothetical protein
MEICYLLAFPDPVEKSLEPTEPIRGLKDAPYFQPVDVHLKTLQQTVIQVGNIPVSITRQRYDERVQIVECHFRLENVLSLAAIQYREEIERHLQELLLPPPHRQSGMFEEYVILLITEAPPTPDQFVDEHAVDLARFIRSQRETFDQRDVADILSSRVRYSASELTVVDWEGAIVIAPEGDFQSDIELLKIGNYQLLRYRLLDTSVESSLRNIREQFGAQPRPLRPSPTRAQIRRIVQHRLELMLDFEHSEQNLLLIGDWYTSQLYHAIREEFYLEEWKQAVKDKLDNLENIISTIQENFSLSWRGLMEQIELIGWIILLIGYFVLFFMDAGLVK